MEVGPSLLDECSRPLAPLGRVDKELQARTREMRKGTIRLRVDVEGVLEELEGRRAQHGHFARPRPRLRDCRSGWDHAIYQAPLKRLLGAVLAAKEPDLAGPLLADDP